MLALLISLLCWIPADGNCSDTDVKFFAVNKQVIPLGANFSLRCEFTCLSPQHVAQMWKESMEQDKVSIINITSALPNVTMELIINSATSNHSGNYHCKTDPPNAITPNISIVVLETLMPSSSPTSSQQLNSTAGLQGQMWYWMILGKTTIFFIMFVSLAVKRRTG